MLFLDALEVQSECSPFLYIVSAVIIYLFLDVVKGNAPLLSVALGMVSWARSSHPCVRIFFDGLLPVIP